MRAFLIALSVVLVVALVAQVLWWRKLLSFGASEPCSEKAVFDSGSLTRLNVQEFAFNKSNLVSELVVFGAEHWLCPNQVSKGCTLFSELSGGR
jgi:hypothetical protein